MKKEELFQLIGEVDEEKILLAGRENICSFQSNDEKRTSPSSKEKKESPVWLKWCTLAACLCIVFGISTYFYQLKNTNGSGFFENGLWGNKDVSLLESHREDFTPVIENNILAQFEENTAVLKSYVLLTNAWFLSDELSDFSQIVTTDCFYVVSGGKESTESTSEVSNQKAYSIYDINENGKIEWDSSAYPPDDASVPYGFSQLTHEIIQDALRDITYEDYIITYGQRLYTVFVWVRCPNEDVILTFPTRPDLLGIENGGIYTLEELQTRLIDFYNQ